MPSRTVLVPPASLGPLDAFRMVSRDMAKISGFQPLEIEALFLGTIVQAGIDRFLIYADQLRRETFEPHFSASFQLCF